MEPAAGITERLLERLSRARRLVVLTGSGVSHESGVPTFRGRDGLWKKYRAEELATRQAFEFDPELVWRWYDYRRQLIAEAAPNPAHEAIARLESHREHFDLVTQNVDGLHSRAGSRSPIELHGNIWRARCTREGLTKELKENPLRDIPPRCHKCGALLRPDVVWFGEPLPPSAYERADTAARTCDAMLVVGTSAMVRPAASLPLIAKHNGAYVVEINVSLTPISVLIDASLVGRAGEILPELVDRLLDREGGRKPLIPGSSEKTESPSR
ncbi:MAG: NAD-dependent protein deacylase [Candidatus Eisenbacteria bacterium]|nr:NAD-dependent protein deacylase [Candidatus Eisenbacteria bacterium]